MNRTILVVDDNAIERRILKKIFSADYDVLEVSTGEEALKVANHIFNKINAIILDIVLPGISGFEVIKTLKSSKILSQIPVIVTTSLDDQESLEKAISSGADNFITKPYNISILRHSVKNAIHLKESAAIANYLRYDKLTMLLNLETFLREAERLARKEEKGYYTLSSIDIDQFKLINEMYGTEKGDQVLLHIANNLNDICKTVDGICCRVSSDKFAVLFPTSYAKTEVVDRCHRILAMPPSLKYPIKINIGRYVVEDLSIPLPTMLDRATMALESVKGNYSSYVADYDDSMKANLLKSQTIANLMEEALSNGEFEPWLQPQHNHATGTIIGAEALVRWKKDGAFISPVDFIPAFEKNGFIYDMDAYIWEKVCQLLRKWIDQGKNPLAISVNISRKDFFHEDFIKRLTGIVDKYHLPYELLRLEVTESAFAEQSKLIITKVNELIHLGFTVEIDDFGSGYSSLNTLKDVPAQILKLDMKFFENTENQERGGNIIESMVRMAKWIGMAIIAEGVEEKAQADYLKSIGCYYIQGYFYSKPIPVDEYEKYVDNWGKETHLTRLKTVKNLDNNHFWDPKSMDTLIFNSYIGGACVFELSMKGFELLRTNDRYLKEFGDLLPETADIHDSSFLQFLDDRNLQLLKKTVSETISAGEEKTCELRLRKGLLYEYIRVTIRLIAQAQDRNLFYCVIINTTAQHDAAKAVRIAAEKANAVINNSNSGIVALLSKGYGSQEFVFTNNRFYEMLGYTPNQFKKEVKDGFSLIYPEDRERIAEGIANLKEVGKMLSFEFRAVKRDGSLIWLREDLSLVKFENINEPIQLCNFVDITAHKETEIREMESARQLQVIMANVNGGVSAITINDDATSHFVFSNDKYFDLYGYTREEALRQNIDVMTLIDPEDLPELMAKVRQLKTTRKPVLIDYRITKPNGKKALLRCNSSIMSIPGYGDDVITSVISDITEKRTLEERLQAIITNINGGISAVWLKDGKAVYEMANDQYFGVVGYTRQQFEDEKVDPFNLVIPEDRERVRRIFLQSQIEGKPYTMEYSITRRDKEIRNILCNTSFIHIFGVDEPVQLSVTNDITDLRKAQKKEKEIHSHLQSVMSVMSNGITAVSYHGNKTKLIFANQRYYQMHGIKEGFNHESIEDLMKLVYPEDREIRARATSTVIETKSPASVDYRIVKDGLIRWFNASLSLARLEGVEDLVIVTYFRDITSEKQSENQLKFLNDTARVIINEKDPEKALNYALRKLLDFFDSDRSYVVEINQQEHTTSNTYECCAAGIESQMSKLQNLPYSEDDIWYQAIRQGEFYATDDVNQIPEEANQIKQLLLSQGVYSIVVAPLMVDHRLIGFAGLDNSKNDIKQVSNLKAISDYLAILLQQRDTKVKLEHDQKAISQLINDTPGGFIRMQVFPDRHPVIDDINIGLCSMLDSTRDEVLSQYADDAYKCINEEDLPAVKKDAREVFPTCGQFTSRCRLKKKDGSYLWVRVFARFTKDTKGRLYLNSYFTDITKAKSAEDLQIELLDNMPTGAAIYEYDGKTLKVIHINRSYWKLVEREPVDYSNASIIPMIHPDDRVLVQQEIDAAIQKKRDIEINIRILCGSSEYKSFILTASIKEIEAGRYYFYVTYELLSDNVMSTQETISIALSTMISSSGDVSYVKDKNLHYLCCSNSMAQLLGIENPRVFIGKASSEFFDKHHSELYDADDNSVLKTGKPIIDEMETFPCSDGRPRLMLTSKYPIMDANSNVIGVYGISRDVTDQKQKNKDLELLTSTISGGLAAYSISSRGIETLYFNDGFINYSGYTRAEYTQMVKDEPLFLIIEEDRPKLLKIVQDFSEKRINGMEASIEFRSRTKDGDIRWMRLKAGLTAIDAEEMIINLVQLDITDLMVEREKLRQAEEEYKIAVHQSGTTIGRYNLKDKTVTIPEKTAKRLGIPQCTEDVPYGPVRLGQISADTTAAYIDFFERLAKGQKECTVIIQKHLEKGWRWLLEHGTTIFDDKGKPVSAVISYSDITEQQEKEAIYRKWQQNLLDKDPDSYTLFKCNLTKNSSYDVVEGKLIDTNVNWKNAESFNEKTLRFCDLIVCDEDRQKYIQLVDSDVLLANYYRKKRYVTFDFRGKVATGRMQWIRLSIELVEYPNTTDVAAYMMYEDINDAKIEELKILDQAQTDSLTGLLNRKTFIQQLQDQLKNRKVLSAIFLLDIDSFKYINDSFGHVSGDGVLVNTSKTIVSMVSASDLVCRIGGDEFVVFMNDVPDKAFLRMKAQQICGAIHGGSNQKFSLTASIGIALCPNDGEDFDTLYLKADRALYYVKNHGKDSFAFSEDL